LRCAISAEILAPHVDGDPSVMNGELAESKTAAPREMRAGPLLINLEERIASVDGKGVALAPKEFRLLETLLQARGRVLTRADLLEQVWKDENERQMRAQAVDVHIGRLRRKLGTAGKYVLTVRNSGYRFAICADWITPESTPEPTA
jgi:DNA-binding response OmpR family regulator